jgi:hypothetical protein
MSRLPAFQQYQYAFTAHIRDPRRNPRPAGVPARRMRIYNQLLYNNLESFLLACFPVSRGVLGARKWARLVRSFFAEHRCRTPFFRQIPEEFVRWLQEMRPNHPEDPPFLPHLAHYEWVELALDVSPNEPDFTAINATGDLLDERPALNPVAWLLSYPYAVHRISRRHRPAVPDPDSTHILAFRNLEDRVRFIVLNPVSARLVALLQPGQASGRHAIEQVIAELEHPNPQTVLAAGRQILESLRAEHALLGTVRDRA